MKNIFLIMIGFILIVACQKPANDSPENLIRAVSGLKTEGSAKSLIMKNEYIDVDLVAMSKNMNVPDENELLKAKAAIYRFYKHVKIIDGYYVADILSGKDINISESAYSALSNNLKTMNESIKKYSLKGEKIHLQEIDDKYLNSLLQ